MSSHTTPLAALLLGVLSAWALGCAGTETTGSGEQNATEVGTTHAQAIEACRAEEEAVLARAGSQAEMTQAVWDYAACLEAANDSVAPQLERNLGDIESYLVGETAARFAGQREAASGACAVIIDASDSVGGSIATMYRADCHAGLEHGLGMLIESYAWLGGDSEPVPLDDSKARASFPSCYDEYDRAIESADSQNAMTQATFGLASCIEDAIKTTAASDGGLVALTADNFPERSLAEIQASVDTALDAAFGAGGATCELLTEAGESGGGSMARTIAGSCRADAAWLVAEQILLTTSEQ